MGPQDLLVISMFAGGLSSLFSLMSKKQKANQNNKSTKNGNEPGGFTVFASRQPELRLKKATINAELMKRINPRVIK
jgi:hypothetical protein